MYLYVLLDIVYKWLVQFSGKFKIVSYPVTNVNILSTYNIDGMCRLYRIH